ncbi:multiple epidermal growth factor-like domains protein 10 [Haliotis rufescens]|uniref:multiple epidermal growth factor-like domains protein 10 n=1 Tax=Haliotis rufescens TaxID=6454 RepID=UPI00201F6A1F|nr:multiple epidermal growth factor-like domains protein 10 [Haliotis rufescens]
MKILNGVRENLFVSRQHEVECKQDHADGYTQRCIRARRVRQSTLISAILVCMVFSTRATGCREGQQCSDCNRTTGYCETECYTGFFDLKCRSSCSKGCRHGQCESTGTGIGRCTEGCVPGVYDIDCKIPCTREEATCVQCPSTCEEGYCQLNSTCVSGCVDSYYGSECKDCSSRCKTCNRITGTCKECQSPFHGLNCSYTRSCETGCVDGCGLVVSANFCVEVCKGNCRPALNMTDASRCLAPSANPQVLCTSECHSQTGECLHGCVEGWYGPRCSSPCSAGCSGGRCDDAGACVDRCRSGYFGRDCEPCHDHCYNHSCNPYTGSCVDGCIVGFYGEFCNDSCDVCSDDMCHQATGTCINGCNVSHSGCEPTCTSNCSRDYCLRGITCAKGTLKAYGISIGIPVTCVLFVLAILMTNYICYRKGRSVERENRIEDEEPCHVVEYQSWQNTMT